jgi:hypothetical protein
VLPLHTMHIATAACRTQTLQLALAVQTKADACRKWHFHRIRGANMKDWEAEYLAARTARHIRAMDKAERVLQCMRDSPDPSDICTSAVRPP